MPEMWLILSYLGLGIFVGFFAGLLGVGGGAIMVPVLTSLFIAQGFPHQHVLHIALASSMAAIIFTAISSVWSQHKRQAVLWPIVLKITPGIMLGAFVMAYFVSLIPTQPLAIIFALFMAVIALQMILKEPLNKSNYFRLAKSADISSEDRCNSQLLPLTSKKIATLLSKPNSNRLNQRLLNKKPKPSRQLPSLAGLSIVGSLIGSLSALIAIGGGSLSVPFLTWCNVPMKKAIATSSAIGFFIALTAVAGYYFGGQQQLGLPELSTGYIYWPAVLLVSIVSVFVAPFGVKMAHKLPVPMLKKIFALLMIGLSIKMLLTL